MATITASDVKKLRDKTSAGMMDCKKALEEAGGNMERAEEILRIQRKTIADKKSATREAGFGVVGTYNHGNGRIGTMVELRCETDFVARGDEFQALLKNLCLQVAANVPLVVERSQLAPEIIAKERDIFSEQARETGKPAERIPAIVEGMMEKNFYSQTVLLEQPFVRDPAVKVGDLVADLSGKTGEKIVVRRFVRFEA